MKMVFKFLFYPLLIILLLNINSFAQTLDTAKTIINGKEFIVHKVPKKETLYKIQKDYGVNEQELLDANPSLDKGLKAGKTIYIPIKNSKIVLTLPNSSHADSLSKIKETNHSKEVFDVALFLPFNYPSFHYAYDTSEDKLSFFDLKENANTVSSLEFYEGIRTSLDSLKKEGLHLNLYTYNLQEDSVEVEKILSKSELKKMKLIIGPLFNKFSDKVATFAKENKIPMVFPFSNGSLIEDNPHTAIVNPCMSTQFNIMAKYISERYKNDNILLVRTNSQKEKETDSIYSKIIEQPWENSGNKHTVKDLNILEKGYDYLKRSLDTGGVNIVIFNSTDEALVSDMVSKLNALRADYDIT